MAMLFITGTPYSDWLSVVDYYVADDDVSEFNQDLAALNIEAPMVDSSGEVELSYEIVSQSETIQGKADQLLSSNDERGSDIYVDSTSNLNLSFWRAVNKSTKFLLFYSSPESALVNYLEKHSFNPNEIETVMNTWVAKTRTMLTFFLNHRSSCLLVNTSSAKSESELFSRAVQNELGFKFEAETTRVEDKESVLLKFLATTLLVKNEVVSELYDELRSAASIISGQDQIIEDISVRNQSLISSFLEEVESVRLVHQSALDLQSRLSLNKCQVSQLEEELKYYYKQYRNQAADTEILANYLTDDPMLKILQQSRRKND